MKSELISRILAQAGKVVQSRSSALVPLHWITAILISSLLVSVIASAPPWIEIGLFVLLTISVSQSILSYNFFMVKNPDALRSEKYALSKFAMDKGLYGDSDAGMRELPRLGSEFLLPDGRDDDKSEPVSNRSPEDES
jgi:hypothetical protein